MSLFATGIVRIISEPQLRTFDNGTSVTNLFGGIGEGKDKNGEYINNGIDCVIWGKSAELVCDKCKKGDSIQVHGTIRRQEWADKQTGEKRSKHIISVSRFEFLPRAANNTSEPDAF